MIYNTRRELADAVISEYNRAVKGQAEQLYYCRAWIFMPDNSDFLILQSYSTIVAAFQRTTGILWVFGFYSNTTAQHIAKFKNWIRYVFQTGWNYPKKVNLYNDSRTGKRAARKNLDDDFASVIVSALNQH
jgi:hypothetical protein|nr:MAG TPA_asm: hypothetical protein [Caudoviricetes sp.]